MYKLKNRKNYIKNNKIAIMSIALMFIAIGFAVISTTLGITSNTTIGKITFDVHFENLIVSEGSMEAKTPATINASDDKKIDFSLDFTTPGQYYEFKANIVNKGSLDAKISNVAVNGLTEEQEKYISINYEYIDGVEINNNDLLKSGEMDIIKVRVEFLKDITVDDLPSSAEALDLIFTTEFVQDDGSGVEREKTTFRTILLSTSEGSDTAKSKYVAGIYGINFSQLPSNTNGKGLYLKAETQNDEYPIYYYRGEVDNNNVLFGGFCWKIVRTTEKGGTKLIYNGVIKNDYQVQPVEKSEYTNIINDSTYAYTYDEETKKWTSNNHVASTNSSIKFNVQESGEYVIDYTISSYATYSHIYVYVNGVVKVDGASGEKTAQKFLGNLSATDIIEVKYSKGYASSSDKTSDNIVFSMDRVIGVKGTNCDNTETDSQLSSTSKFGTSYNTLADVGYMYGTRYSYTYWTDTAYVYGSDVTYNDGVYTLTETSASDKITNIKTKHYTCKLTTTGTCSTVYYVYYYQRWDATTYRVYALPLKGGNKLEDVIGNSFANTNNSPIKTVIDTWFASNLLDYESKLEDAVWCNDRSIAKSGYLKNEDATKTTYFGAYGTRELTTFPKPALKDEAACPNQNDRFTVRDTTKGNGALTYPVGLLTFDEAIIAGHIFDNKSYLYTGNHYWLMSPYTGSVGGYYYSNAGVSAKGSVSCNSTDTVMGVRPAIVLKRETMILGGDGTSNNPYVVA